MKFKSIALFAALGLSLSLAACKDAPEEQQGVGATNVANMTEAEIVNELPAEAPPATQVTNRTTSEAPPAATLAPDEQTQDDADATGMTAKVNRDEGGNDSGQPAN